MPNTELSGDDLSYEEFKALRRRAKYPEKYDEKMYGKYRSNKYRFPILAALMMGGSGAGMGALASNLGDAGAGAAGAALGTGITMVGKPSWKRALAAMAASGIGAGGMYAANKLGPAGGAALMGGVGTLAGAGAMHWARRAENKKARKKIYKNNKADLPVEEKEACCRTGERNMTPYERGFLTKCAEYGVDGRALLKAASPLSEQEYTDFLNLKGIKPDNPSIVYNEYKRRRRLAKIIAATVFGVHGGLAGQAIDTSMGGGEGWGAAIGAGAGALTGLGAAHIGNNFVDAALRNHIKRNKQGLPASWWAT